MLVAVRIALVFCSIALATDKGTPSLLEPGYRLSPSKSQIYLLAPASDRPEYKRGVLHPDDVREMAVYTLGRGRAIGAVPALKAILKEKGTDDRHRMLRKLTLDALSSIGGKDANDAISDAEKNDPDAYVRNIAATYAKRPMAAPTIDDWGKRLSHNDEASAPHELLKAVADLAPVVIRSIAAEQLGRSADPKALNYLLAALKNEKVLGVRFKILQALRELGTEEAVAALKEYADGKIGSEQDKQYAEFLIGKKNALVEGNSVGTLKAETPSDKKPAAPTLPMPSDTTPEKTPTKPMVRTVTPSSHGLTNETLLKHVRPVAGKDEKGSPTCLYEYEGRCYQTLEDLQNYLLAAYRKKKDPKVKDPEPFPIVRVDKTGKETTQNGFNFDGQRFTSSDALLLHLIQSLGGEEKKAPSGPSEPEKGKDEEKTKPKDDDVYRPFDVKKEKIGEFHSQDGGYLRFATYGGVGLKGPRLVKQHGRQPREANKEDTRLKTKVCFDEKRLRALLPPGEIDPSKASEAQLEEIVPVTETTVVVKGSLKIEAGQVCYQLMEAHEFIFSDDITEARDASRKMLKGFKGIHALPPEVQTKLKTAWDSGKELPEKVAAVEAFWRGEVEYLLDDHGLYKKYFETNPDHNLLQAACALKKGRCVPKNFGLGIAIHQLSGGEVPIRFHSVFWMDASEKPKADITTDRGHLQVQYLTVEGKDDQRFGTWTSAEASVSNSTAEQMAEAEKQNGDIRKTIEAEMKGRKMVDVPLNATFFVEETYNYTQAGGGRYLKHIDVKALGAPRTEKSLLKLAEKNGDLIITSGDGKPQVIPKASLVDLQTKPELLTVFLGIEGKNRVGIQRSWSALGGRRYRDVRIYSILVPGGKPVTIQDDFVLDFGKDAILEKLTRSVGGTKTLVIEP